MLAALAASAVAISSCSDNDVLDSTTKAKGNALIVNASLNDGSRIATTGSDGFKSFMLYGYTNPTSGTPTSLFDVTGDGIAYQKTSGTWGLVDANLASKAVWPSSSGGTYNFYALSVGGSHELDASTNGLGLSTIKNGIFTYTMPKNNDGTVNLAAQKDILVACNNGATKGESGVLTLPFKHAFAKLTLQIRWNYQEWINNGVTSPASVIESNALLVIDYVKIHNIKCNGSYSFTADDGNGGKGKWTVDGENSTIMFKYETPRRFTAQNYTLKDEYLAAHPEVTDPTDEGLLAACNADPFKVQDLRVGDEAIMILPQKLALWENTGSFATNTSGPFIEIHCCAYNTTGASEDEIKNINWWDEGAGDIFVEVLGSQDETDRYMTSIYFPIRVNSTTPFTFEANKSYNFRLNVATSRQDNGTNAIKGVVVDPS